MEKISSEYRWENVLLSDEGMFGANTTLLIIKKTQADDQCSQMCVYASVHV